jgi:hypothetical protein
VLPFSGPAVGGTLLTLTGTGFSAGASVTVGGSVCTSVSVVSSTQITCTSPAGSVGVASVVVTSGGQSNGANSLFTYVAAPTSFVALAPSRVLDTRGGAKIGALNGDGVPKVFNVYGKGGVPLNRVSAVVFTVTVVDSEVGDEGGYITVFPCASGRPYSSSLNFVSGQTSANTVIAPVDVNGDVCFYSYGRTHLLADISGYISG